MIARKRRGTVPVGALFPLILVLAGCEASVRGEPNVSLDPDRDFSATIINATLEKGRLAELSTSSTLVPPGERNAVVFARLAELDYLYYEYERDISRELRESGFVLTLAGLAVGGAGSFVPETASRILSAASAGIAGVQDAYSKEILIDRTIQALLSQMRAGRDQTKARILTKLGSDATSYPLQAAVADIEAYRQAGTLTGALVGITTTAAAEEQRARVQLEAIETTVLKSTGRVEDLRPDAQKRIVAITAAIRDTSRTSDARVLELANGTTVDDPDYAATLAAYRESDAGFVTPELARLALVYAIQEMERSESQLGRWESLLGI